MFALDRVVPWGRSFDEYVAMFALAPADLKGLILGCGDGPASFNAEATSRGTRVISCDPMYRWRVDEIEGRMAATSEQILEQTRRNRDQFIWTSIASVEALGGIRLAAMRRFLTDLPDGRRQNRYVAAELPALPFAAHAFDLALCSHLLFLYTEQLGEPFHHQSVLELARVAREVRIFPLLTLGGRRSPFVDSVSRDLDAAGCRVSIEAVPYEFQRGGNQMMRIRIPFEPVRLAG